MLENNIMQLPENNIMQLLKNKQLPLNDLLAIILPEDKNQQQTHFQILIKDDNYLVQIIQLIDSYDLNIFTNEENGDKNKQLKEREHLIYRFVSQFIITKNPKTLSDYNNCAKLISSLDEKNHGQLINILYADWINNLKTLYQPIQKEKAALATLLEKNILVKPVSNNDDDNDIYNVTDISKNWKISIEKLSFFLSGNFKNKAFFYDALAIDTLTTILNLSIQTDWKDYPGENEQEKKKNRSNIIHDIFISGFIPTFNKQSKKTKIIDNIIKNKTQKNEDRTTHTELLDIIAQNPDIFFIDEKQAREICALLKNHTYKGYQILYKKYKQALSKTEDNKILNNICTTHLSEFEKTFIAGLGTQSFSLLKKTISHLNHSNLSIIVLQLAYALNQQIETKLSNNEVKKLIKNKLKYIIDEAISKEDILKVLIKKIHLDEPAYDFLLKNNSIMEKLQANDYIKALHEQFHLTKLLYMVSTVPSLTKIISNKSFNVKQCGIVECMAMYHIFHYLDHVLNSYNKLQDEQATLYAYIDNIYNDLLERICTTQDNYQPILVALFTAPHWSKGDQQTNTGVIFQSVILKLALDDEQLINKISIESARLILQKTMLSMNMGPYGNVMIEKFANKISPEECIKLCCEVATLIGNESNKNVAERIHQKICLLISYVDTNKLLTAIYKIQYPKDQKIKNQDLILEKLRSLIIRLSINQQPTPESGILSSTWNWLKETVVGRDEPLYKAISINAKTYQSIKKLLPLRDNTGDDKLSKEDFNTIKNILTDRNQKEKKSILRNLETEQAIFVRTEKNYKIQQRLTLFHHYEIIKKDENGVYQLTNKGKERLKENNVQPLSLKEIAEGMIYTK